MHPGSSLKIPTPLAGTYRLRGFLETIGGAISAAHIAHSLFIKAELQQGRLHCDVQPYLFNYVQHLLSKGVLGPLVISMTAA